MSDTTMAEQDTDTTSLTAWADDEYVIAQQLLTLTGMYGPDVEESVALGSIAQDHLGHAMNLYRRFEAGDRAIDRLVYERDYGDFLACDLAAAWEPDNWCWIVARQAVYDLANLHRARWAEQAWPSMAGLARMVQRESDLHLEHWWEWLAVTGRNTTLAPQLEPSLASVLPLVPSFFVFDRASCPWSDAVSAFEQDLRQRIAALGLDTSWSVVHAGPEVQRRTDDQSLTALLRPAHAEYRTAPDWNWGTDV